MPFRLFYCPAGWDYPQLLWSHKPWVVAEWQRTMNRGQWYGLGSFYTASHAHAKLQYYQERSANYYDTED